MWAKPLYICKKGVAALAPKASLKWLGRTLGGGGLVFCDKLALSNSCYIKG